MIWDLVLSGWHLRGGHAYRYASVADVQNSRYHLFPAAASTATRGDAA